MQQIKRIEDGVRLRVQHEDDLWTLAQLIGPGCSVGMMGFRRDQSTGTQESGRAKAADRKPMWIVLNAESTEFQQFTDNLRIHGIITEATLDKGSHHTHAVGPRDEVEISWTGGISESDRSLLAEAVKDGGRGRVSIAVVESDEILLFEIAQHGMRQVGDTFTLRGGGKREGKSTEVRNAFLAKVAEQASKAISAEMPVVICGPGMAREHFEREEAEIHVEELERARVNFVQKFWKVHPNEATHYHMMLNMGRMSPKIAAEVIAHAAGDLTS